MKTDPDGVAKAAAQDTQSDAASAEAGKRGPEGFAAAAESAGSAIAKEIAKEQRRRRLRVLLIKTGALLAVLILLLLFAWPKISPLFAKREPAGLSALLPGSFGELLPDESLGYNRFDLQNAVLGEAREKRSLVVLEQDVQVDSQISQALANIGVFEKTKTVHSAGTGVYTVDLSRLSRRKVQVDMEAGLVTLSIPHAALSYIVIDPEKTVFEETEKAFLAFGEIKLTPEQQTLLETSVKQTMEGFLTDPERLSLADRLAVEQVRALFAPVISAVADGFTLQVTLE